MGRRWLVSVDGVKIVKEKERKGKGGGKYRRSMEPVISKTELAPMILSFTTKRVVKSVILTSCEIR